MRRTKKKRRFEEKKCRCIQVLAIVTNQHRISRILNCDCWAIAERMTEYKRKREEVREREKKKRKK